VLADFTKVFIGKPGSQMLGAGMGAPVFPGSAMPGFGASPTPSGGGGVLLIGEIREYGHNPPPPKWLFCDGQTVSQATYAGLFAVCGVLYNTGGEPAGDFRLPDMRNRIVAFAGSNIALASSDGLAEAARQPISHAHVAGQTVGPSPGNALGPGDLADSLYHSYAPDSTDVCPVFFEYVGGVAVVGVRDHAHSLNPHPKHTDAQVQHAHGALGVTGTQAAFPSYLAMTYMIFAGV